MVVTTFNNVVYVSFKTEIRIKSYPKVPSTGSRIYVIVKKLDRKFGRKFMTPTFIANNEELSFVWVKLQFIFFLYFRVYLNSGSIPPFIPIFI